MATQTVDPTAQSAVVARGTVSPNLVSIMRDVFEPKQGFLATYNIERTDQIELLGVSTAAGIDPLFLGHPGVGKTWMIELLLLVMDLLPEQMFNTLVFKETPADDILGMRSLPAMKQGIIERLMDGYLPTAVVAYLDEIFKASPTLVNALLDVMANRKLKVGNKVHKLSQLLLIVGSSNELPDREDMAPFRDRWAITNFVPAVQTPEGRKAVMRIQDEFQANASSIDTSNMPKLTQPDLQTIRAEVRSVIVPDAVFESMAEAQERWAQKGIEPSTRRVGQMILAIKARAWLRGDDHCVTDDMIVTQHMAWNLPDHANDAREVVLEFANVFARKAARMKEGLEPILTELDRVKKEIADNGGEPTDDHMDATFKVMRQLRSMRKDAREQIAAGERQGQDVRDLNTVLDEVNRAHTWIEQSMVGDE